jgi:hypothetical protein
MSVITELDLTALERVCDVLADTSTGLTGSEMGNLLALLGIADPLPGMAVPTSRGSGRRYFRPPLPWIKISPALQQMSADGESERIGFPLQTFAACRLVQWDLW